MNKIIFHREYQSESELTVAVIVRFGLNDHAQARLWHSVGNKGNNFVYIFFFESFMLLRNLLHISHFL